MLSKKQMRRLIKSVYGTGNQFGDEIVTMYNRASRQIKVEITAFIQEKASYTGTPSKTDLEDVRGKLEQLAQNPALAPLVAVYATAVSLGHPNNGDVLNARLAIPMIKVAEQRHQQFATLRSEIPRDVARISRDQNQETPEMHPLPVDYSPKMASIERETPGNAYNAVNRDIQTTLSRIAAIAKQAAQSTDDNLNWAGMIDRVLTGKNTTAAGASGRAKSIIRTTACQELNRATIADFKARGVGKYRFYSLEAENTCQECSDMDYNVYDVADAEEGVNLPPMHPNCQCWIVEFEDEGELGDDQDTEQTDNEE